MYFNDKDLNVYRRVLVPDATEIFFDLTLWQSEYKQQGGVREGAMAANEPVDFEDLHKLSAE